MKGDFKAQGWKGVYCLLYSVDFSAKKREGEGGRGGRKNKEMKKPRISLSVYPLAPALLPRGQFLTFENLIKDYSPLFDNQTVAQMIYSDVFKIFLLRNKTSDGIRIKNDNISQQFVNKQEPERDRTTASKFLSNCF